MSVSLPKFQTTTPKISIIDFFKNFFNISPLKPHPKEQRNFDDLNNIPDVQVTSMPAKYIKDYLLDGVDPGKSVHGFASSRPYNSVVANSSLLSEANSQNIPNFYSLSTPEESEENGVATLTTQQTWITDMPVDESGELSK